MPHPTVTTPVPAPALALGRARPLALALLIASACDHGRDLDDIESMDRWRQSSASPVGVASVSPGSSTTCALDLEGRALCWGLNDRGQLGRGHTIDIGDDETLEGSDFIELGALAQQVVTNGEQTFALLQDGSVRAWGVNDGHQLGLQHATSIGDDETPASATVAVDVPLGAAALQLAVGEDFACARLTNGTARCWGANDFGQLGRRHTQFIGDDEAPALGPAVFLGAPIVDLAAGRHHACALVQGGGIYCWGRGAEGQLGHADTENLGDNEFPVMAGPVPVGGPAVQVVAGGLHTCARLTTGQVRCWGDGLDGQLGYGASERVGDDERPDQRGPVPLAGSAVALAAGREHTCAILDTGGLRCWGANDVGQLGYGHTDPIGDDETPDAVAEVQLGEAEATAIFSGSEARSTCALLDDQSLRCWGANDLGQLGYGHVFDVGDDLAERPGDLPDILILSHDDEA